MNLLLRQPKTDVYKRQEEAKALIDTFPSVGNPIIIFTGGDPMIRPDVYELIAYAGSKGLRCVMSPNGTLITPENARKIKEAGVQRCSISIDGYNAEKHDAFRCVPGAFEATMRGIECLKAEGVEFQINTTVTRDNPVSYTHLAVYKRQLRSRGRRPLQNSWRR